MKGSRAIAVAMVGLALAGCQTTTKSMTHGPVRMTGSVGAAPARPTMASTGVASAIGSTVGKGDDFAAAIAALATTPGSGVRAVSAPAAMALAEPTRTRRQMPSMVYSKPSRATRQAAPRRAAPVPVTALQMEAQAAPPPAAVAAAPVAVPASDIQKVRRF